MEQWTAVLFCSVLFCSVLQLSDAAATVIPNLGENGTIVHLHSGMVLVWDGRLLRHCTAMAADGPGVDNHLYGFATLARD